MQHNKDVYQKPHLHVADKTSVLLKGDFGPDDDGNFREPIETNPDKRKQQQEERDKKKESEVEQQKAEGKQGS